MDKIKRDNILYTIFYSFLAAFLVFLLVFNNVINFEKPGDQKVGVKYEKARAMRILSDTRGPDPDMPDIQIGIQTIEFKVLTGSYAGKIITAKNFISRTDNKPAKVGTVMLLATYDRFATATVENYNRDYIVYALSLIFVLLVALLGKKTGMKSIVSLAFTLICVLFLFIPMIIKGVPPVIAAMLVVMLSTSVTFIFVSGFGKKTYIAAAGCIICTFIAGLVSFIVGRISNISTLNTPEAEDLIFVATHTSLRIHDLLFAGILIASVGAIMDTAMSITSSVLEMKELNPKITRAQLLKSGMNVGRDVMGTMTNTLILAFAGSSINIFVIYYMYQLPYVQLINIDLIVIQMIQGLSGSIGVVLSIPVCALLASGSVHWWFNKSRSRG